MLHVWITMCVFYCARFNILFYLSSSLCSVRGDDAYLVQKLFLVVERFDKCEHGLAVDGTQTEEVFISFLNL